MKLGLMTAALPAALARRRWPHGRPARASRCSRSPAGPRPPGERGATPASATSTSRTSTPTASDRRWPTHGLEISSLAYYPNNLAGDDARARRRTPTCRKVIDAAAALEVGIVGTFAGADQTLPLPENLQRFRTRLAAARRVRRGARREDRHRELPDDLQLGRVAGRPEPRPLAGGLGRDVRRHPRRRASASTSTRRISSGCRSTTSAWSTTTRRASSTSTPRTSRSAATASTGTARSRSAWAGRCRGCPGSARCAGTASSRRCTRSATTSWSRSSTRTARFEATEELVKRGFLLSRNVLRPLLV